MCHIVILFLFRFFHPALGIRTLDFWVWSHVLYRYATGAQAFLCSDISFPLSLPCASYGGFEPSIFGLCVTYSTTVLLEDNISITILFLLHIFHQALGIRTLDFWVPSHVLYHCATRAQAFLCNYISFPLSPPHFMDSNPQSLGLESSGLPLC
jgi:hypothetical protein